jgi:hypothetical protein
VNGKENFFKNVITRDEAWVCGYEAKQVITVEESMFVVFQKKMQVPLKFKTMPSYFYYPGVVYH